MDVTREPARKTLLRRPGRVPGGIRTPNLLIRSQKLYPVELQALQLDHKIGNAGRDVPGAARSNRNSAIEISDKKGGQRDSNPQQPEPQSGALPLSYDHHLN